MLSSPQNDTPPLRRANRQIGLRWALVVLIAVSISLVSAWRLLSRESDLHIPSPTGDCVLHAFVNDGMSSPERKTLIGFVIKDKTQRTIFSCQTIASDRMRWRIGWDAINRVWLNSQDIGYLVWEFDPVRQTWRELPDGWRKLPAPDSVSLPRR